VRGGRTSTRTTDTPLKRSLAQRILRASGLPSLEPVVVEPEAEVPLRGIADRLEAGDGEAIRDAPLPKVELLRWLTQRRDVLFHGSARRDIETLVPIRRSRDTTEFGNQQAVYASNDPVWAIYFALLRRDTPFGTRNCTIGIVEAGVYPRWYAFSLRPRLDPETRFGPGSLYVLPRGPFRPEPPLLGVIDTAQWVSPERVEPIVRIDVELDDFPFLRLVGPYFEWEPTLVTIVRSAARNRTA
jgi:hypothetical protein